MKAGSRPELAAPRGELLVHLRGVLRSHQDRLDCIFLVGLEARFAQDAIADLECLVHAQRVDERGRSTRSITFLMPPAGPPSPSTPTKIISDSRPSSFAAR